MTVIDRPAGKGPRPRCPLSCRLPAHSGKGSLGICTRCGRWAKCRTHMPNIGCYAKGLGLLGFSDRRAIKRHLRGQGAGE